MLRGTKRVHEGVDRVRGVRARGGELIEHVGGHSSSRSSACRSPQVAPEQGSPVALMPSAICPGGAARAADGERRAGASTLEEVLVVRRVDGVSAVATPSSAATLIVHKLRIMMK